MALASNATWSAFAENCWRKVGVACGILKYDGCHNGCGPVGIGDGDTVNLGAVEGLVRATVNAERAV